MKRTRASTRQRRKALAKELAAKRASMRAELARRRKASGKTKKGKRRWWLWALLAILLWLFMPDCSCQCREPPAAAIAVGPSVSAPEPEPVVPEPSPLTGKIATVERPAFQSEPPPPLLWVGAFRMQVAARSPRLSECFVGAARPGSLRWTTSVEPVHGQVSEHVLEPTLMSDPLTQVQRKCVLGVLADPPYKLPLGQARATPSRVGLVIEF